MYLKGKESNYIDERFPFEIEKNGEFKFGQLAQRLFRYNKAYLENKILKVSKTIKVKDNPVLIKHSLNREPQETHLVLKNVDCCIGYSFSEDSIVILFSEELDGEVFIEYMAF